MKRSTKMVLAAVALYVLYAVSRDGEAPRAQAVAAPAAPAKIETKAETPPSEMEKAREEVVAYFKSGEEPKVKDSVWTADRIFKVGMISDGSDRSGYAEYVCNVLYDHGFKGKKVWVQVIDIVKLTRTNKWEKLGEAHCI
jgi:hypothetical protein